MTALAAGLIAFAWLAGQRHGSAVTRRSTIEGMLARTDLTRDERVLLMQRAGSAYVEAAHAYAANVVRTDSTALEVSSQVLIGAAQAVARTNMDGGLAPRLGALLRDSRARRSTPLNSVIWY